jgi:hypothetical protein
MVLHLFDFGLTEVYVKKPYGVFEAFLNPDVATLGLILQR